MAGKPLGLRTKNVQHMAIDKTFRLDCRGKGATMEKEEAGSRAGVPVWHRYALSVSEASKVFHIGEKRIREIIREDPDADYILTNGTHILIKSRLFEEYLDGKSAI